MKCLRTPDERFENLDGYPFSPNYLETSDQDGGTLRIHYVDEGPKDAPIVLCMHGEPSWAYLYRKMVPVFVNAGFRAIAPDLVGFGRSDKPAEPSDYTYARHVAWMQAVLETLDLNHITLMCQDWGSLIGLRLAAEHPDRFAQLAIANGFLPTGDQQMPEAFFQWRKFSQEVPEFSVSKVIDMGTTRELTDPIRAAYDAPFPDESYKAGARVFPMLVPTSTDDPATAPNRAAWKVLKAWTKPVLTAFSDQDPITKGGDVALQQAIPGAKDQPHTTITGAGHFLQEDQGEQLAEAVVKFMKA